VYHIWNRGAGRLRLFKKPADYLAFERVLVEAHARHPIPLLERTKGDVDDSGAECPERGGGKVTGTPLH